MSNQESAPAKGGKMGLIVMAVLGLLSIGAGAALPFFLPKPHAAAPVAKPVSEEHGKKHMKYVKFGDIVVNLQEERLNRYLRVKIDFMVDDADEKEVTKVLEHRKPVLKSWLNSYLSDRTVADCTGAVGFNRLRREIRDQFNALLFEDGSEKICEIIFDEFVVQ